MFPNRHRSQSSPRPRLRCPWARPGRDRSRPSVGGVAGQEGAERRPPPSRSSTQARPPCSSANIATSESPMPVPGACEDAVGPCRNGSKISCRSSTGTPCPSSSTAMTAPPFCDQTRTQIPTSGSVCRTPFITRFSTIRSIFGASTGVRGLEQSGRGAEHDEHEHRQQDPQQIPQRGGPATRATGSIVHGRAGGFGTLGDFPEPGGETEGRCGSAGSVFARCARTGRVRASAGRSRRR